MGNLSTRTPQSLITNPPIWAGPALAVVAFLLVRYVLPLVTELIPGDQSLGRQMNALFLPIVAWVLAFAILFAWAATQLLRLMDRRLLDNQTGPESIRALPWDLFERLVSEAYRRRGYTATVTGGRSDGGVDVVLVRPGEKVVVQCKQWRAYKVGAPIVRDLLGAVTHHKATRGIVVTSGRFTREAQAFAAANHQLELVDGPQLAALIAEVQREHATAPTTTEPPPLPVAPRHAASPSCPSCASIMVRRTALRGTHAGESFWGCPRYPACRGTRQGA